MAQLSTLGHITQHKNMKTKIIKLVALTIVSVCASLSAHCQTNSNGLAIISTDASLGTDASHGNAPSLFLTVNLLNTTNHDIVVLTKNLNCGFDRDNTNKWAGTVGLDDSTVVTYQGHKIVPSFYDFAPVTLRPNEVAVVSATDYFPTFTTNTQITVRYSISADWGSRFGTWVGSVTSEPLKVSGPN